MLFAWYGAFFLGAALFWGAVLSPLARTQGRFASARMLIERYWRRGKDDELLVFPEYSPAERAFLEKTRLAGIRWPYRSYRTGRWLFVAGGVYLYAAFMFFGSGSVPGVLKLAAGAAAMGGMCWFAPPAAIALLAARRKALILGEISKFAHRMSICITDQSDIRELILRAGRPLALLQPHLQQLAAQWGNDQREAILAFKDALGISEVYPLINAFASLSRARPQDVKRLLIEHSRSIDASLEADLAKRIENAPVWISFYIMIPFLVCLLLFVYPWVLTVLEQLSVSFTAG